MKFRCDISRDIELAIASINSRSAVYQKAASLGNLDPNQVYARSFYDVMIRPYILKGRVSRGSLDKTFRIDENYLSNLVADLVGKGVVFRMYVRMLQSRPGEIQSDTRIGYGMLEFLRVWSIRVAVAKELKLNFSVDLIDESGAFEQGDLIGFTAQSVKESHDAIDLYLKRLNVDGLVFVSRFDLQTSVYREPGYNRYLSEIYMNTKRDSVDRVMADIGIGIYNLHTRRLLALHKLRYGETFKTVFNSGNLCYLDKFNQDDVRLTAVLSESFFASLAMREYREVAATLKQFDNHPVRCGITKSAQRLSIAAYNKSLKGVNITPGYGLPLYDRGHNFVGMVNYIDSLDGRYARIYSPSGVVTALVMC